MKNLILIFLFILSVQSSAETTASSSENGFIVTSNQFKDYVQTTIFDTKKKSLRDYYYRCSFRVNTQRRTYSSK